VETGKLSSEAVATLVAGHRQFLSFLENRVESREVAEDILQAAFVRSLERGADIGNTENVVAWFYRVLRNAVVDHYRHRASSERAVNAWGRESVFEAMPEAELHRQICGCLSELVQSLKPEYAEALQVVDLDEGSLNDLATRAGITSGNAAVRVHRAREALKKQVVRACGTCAEHGCFDCHCVSIT
jgi:RNA polymerase sigma-70 factor, ECF subfamily